MTDSLHCTTEKQQGPTSMQFSIQPNGLNIPHHFHIPPIHHPPPYTMDYHPPPQPCIWPQNTHSPQFSVPPANFNTVTRQYLPFPHNNQGNSHQFRMHQPEPDRNDTIHQMGGVSYYADAVLKSPRLEIPLFAGDDPIGWLQQCEKIFDMSETPYEQWVNIATGHFCGRANVWLKNICVPWQMVNWQQFCQMIADRFTQANANEAVEMLKNIQQTSTVIHYIDKFEECVQLVKRDHPYLQEAFLMSCFIGGLRPDIKFDVSGQRPRGILEAYWYAKVYENSASAKRSYYQSLTGRQRTHFHQTNFKFPPKPIQTAAAEKGNHQGNTNTNDRPARQCWYCKEPCNREHKCKQGRTLHIMQELDDESTEESEPEPSPTTEQTFHTAPNTPNNTTGKSELMHLSAHAVEGTASIATFSLLIQIGGQQAVALVDSGSSNTFMDYKFALKTNCHLTPTTPKKISVAGGGLLTSEYSVQHTPYVIQGNKFSSTFHVLPLHTYDIILGIDWMYTFSPVTLDLPLRILTVVHRGRTIQLKDHTTPPDKCVLDASDMKKLLAKSVLGCIIQIHALEQTVQQQNIVLPEEVEQILQEFQTVTAEPAGLPPSKECDHAIPLVAGAQPPNLRPYRVPHM